MLALFRQRKYRAAKDRRDADKLVREFGEDALRRARSRADASSGDSREEAHWRRIAKIIEKM